VLLLFYCIDKQRALKMAHDKTVSLMKFFITSLFVTMYFSCVSQIKLTKLSLKPKETYKITDSDILVVDTLIMGDSSQLIISDQHKENFLHIKWLNVGKGCLIDGRGKIGLKGRIGRHGINAAKQCANGRAGQHGENGSAGADGKKITIYLNAFIFRGTLLIDTQGGDGGNGGNGGEGGNGGRKNKTCKGGYAGNGGNGGDGGTGGKGGDVTIVCEKGDYLRKVEGKQLLINVAGGSGGKGGRKGFAGLFGGDPLKDDKVGRNGVDGKKGLNGVKGISQILKN
jgi:hypothetical protein